MEEKTRKKEKEEEKKMRNKNVYNAYIVYSVFIILIALLAIPTAEARIGVWKNYDNLTKTISIRNLLNNPVVELQLLENTEQCINCHALIKINSKFDLDLSAADYYLMNFLEAKGRLESWKWAWYYLQDETYNESWQCVKRYENTTEYDAVNKTYSYPKKAIMGTCSEIKTRQILIYINEKNGFIQKNRDYYILLEGKLSQNSAVEWIPTFYGVELNEWAWWNSNYAYKRLITFNTSVSSAVKVPYLLNSSNGLIGQEIWAIPQESFSKSNNYSMFWYYNNFSDGGALVNFSEDTQMPHDATNGTERSYNAYQMWQSNNIQGVWHLNNTKNAAQVLHNITWSGTTAYTIGKIGYGRRLSQLANSWGSIPHHAELEATNFSICIWVNFSAMGTAERIMAKTAGAAGQYDLNKQATDLFEWSYRQADGTGYAVNSLTKPIVNTWIHICGTYDSLRNFTIYVNGTAEASSIGAVARGSGTGNLSFGTYITGNPLLLNGSLDEPVYFNITLTPHEVKAYYEAMTKSHSELGAEQVSNTAPTIVTKTLTPASPVTTDNLICTTNITDADGSAKLSGNLTFFRNNIANYSFNQSVTSGINISVTLGEGNTTVNDVYICQVDAYDGTAHTLSNTSSVTIQSLLLSIDLNWTDLPAYTNKTKNYTFRPYGSAGSYNVSVNLYNGSALYVSYLVPNLANNTLFSNTTTQGHSGETWNVSANTSHEDTIKINSTRITMQNLVPNTPFDITPTPANDTWITDTTPTINMSVDDADGNSSLNCHFYLGTTSSPSYNSTTQTNSRGICEFTTPILAENTYYYWKAQADDTQINSSFSPVKQFRIDVTIPSYSDITPTNLSYTSNSTPPVYVNLTDTFSGIDNNTIEFFVKVNAGTWQNVTTHTNATRKNIANGIQVSYNTDPLTNADVEYANVSAKDNAGNSIRVYWYFTVDIASPSVTLVSPNNDTTINIQPQNFTANATDANSNLSSVSFRLWNANSNILNYTRNLTIDVYNEINKSNTTITNFTFRTDGTYHWNYYFCDNATGGGTSANCAYAASNRSITVWVKPSVDVPALNPVNAYGNSTLNCSTNITDNTLGSLTAEFKLYNGSALFYNKNITAANGTLVSINNTGEQFVNENWNCSVTPWDATGSGTMQSKNVTILNIAPTISLQAPANRTNTTDNTPNFIFNYTDEDLTRGNCTLYVNNVNVGSNSSVTSGINTTITSSALTDGLNKNWYVNCSDGSNTTQSEIRVIGIDTTLPVLTITQPTGEYFAYGLPYNNLNITFNYTEANAGSCWYYLYSNSSIISSEYSGAGLSVFDGSSGTYENFAGAANLTVFANFSNKNTNGGIYRLIKGDSSDGGHQANMTAFCYNSSNKWEQFLHIQASGITAATTYEAEIPLSCLNSSKTRIGLNLSIRQNAVGRLYEMPILYQKNLDNCQNSTLNISDSGNNTFYLYMNDTFGNSNSKSSNFTINLLNSSSQFIDGNISESQKITFTLQINSSNLTSINATLLWNSTNYYYDTLSNNSRQANFTKIIYMPLVNFSSWNVSWNWNYTINEIHTNQTTNQTLQIWQINFTNCSAGTTLRTINFSYANEKTLSKMVGDLDATFTVFKDKILINRTFAYKWINRSSAEFCIYPDWANYSANMYGIFTTPSYSQRSYHLINESISNSTKNLTLYHLNTTDATNLLAKVKDKISNLLKNVYVKMYRFYPDLNEWRLVEVGKTDTFGQTVLHIVQNDVDYKFILIQDGAEVYSGLSMRIVCVDTTTQPCSYEFVVGIEGDIIIDLIAGISHRLKYNNNTGFINFDFSSISGLAKKVSLAVIQRNVTGETTICNSTITSTGGTLNCHIGNKTGVFYGRAYSDTKLVNLIVVTLRGILTTATSTFRADGIIWSIILIVTLFLIGIWNPVVAIGLSLLGLAVTAIFGLAALPVAFVIGLFILGVISMLKLRT